MANSNRDGSLVHGPVIYLLDALLESHAIPRNIYHAHTHVLVFDVAAIAHVVVAVVVVSWYFNTMKTVPKRAFRTCKREATL